MTTGQTSPFSLAKEREERAVEMDDLFSTAIFETWREKERRKGKEKREEKEREEKRERGEKRERRKEREEKRKEKEKGEKGGGRRMSFGN